MPILNVMNKYEMWSAKKIKFSLNTHLSSMVHILYIIKKHTGIEKDRHNASEASQFREP